jgi:MFS family permease
VYRAASLRTIIRNRGIVCAAAAVVTAGLTSGVCALLVPAELHAAGASPARIGLDFAVAGIGFAIGSALTAAAGRRAVNVAAICFGMLAQAAALSLAAVSAATLPLVAMLYVTTAARSVLWTVSYPLAATSAEQDGTGVGSVVGLLNGIWAATTVAGPLAAGVTAERLNAQAAFALTGAACIAALVLTATAAWRARARPASGTQARCRPTRNRGYARLRGR